MKVKESFKVTFDERSSPSKTSPLEDDDLVGGEGINIDKIDDLGNNTKSETLEIDEIINIMESKNHPSDNVIGILIQRSQAQDKSNFFCFISTIKPKNIDEAIKDERSGAVRDEILSKRHRFRSLEYEQERVIVTFGAIWRPGENRDLQLQLAEERRTRLKLAEVVNSMRRRQEPKRDA
ncbi:hypothetical protein Tco_0001118 [Tanacetum coccineum]